MKDGGVAEEPHVEETAEAKSGTPEPAMNGPTAEGQIVRRPAAAHLHDRNLVAFFRKPESGDAAPESRSDHDKVEIECTFVGPGVIGLIVIELIVIEVTRVG